MENSKAPKIAELVKRKRGCWVQHYWVQTKLNEV